MSKSPSAVVATEQVWFNAKDAAEYMHRLGFRNITAYSVKREARQGKLHEGKPKGKAFHWHRDWLDEWASNES